MIPFATPLIPTDYSFSRAIFFLPPSAFPSDPLTEEDPHFKKEHKKRGDQKADHKNFMPYRKIDDVRHDEGQINDDGKGCSC